MQSPSPSYQLFLTLSQFLQLVIIFPSFQLFFSFFFFPLHIPRLDPLFVGVLNLVLSFVIPLAPWLVYESVGGCCGIDFIVGRSLGAS